MIEGEIVIINHNFNSSGVHQQFLAEGAGFVDQHAAPLAQGTIDGFDDARAAVAFVAAAVLSTGQYVHVGGK